MVTMEKLGVGQNCNGFSITAIGGGQRDYMTEIYGGVSVKHDKCYFEMKYTIHGQC